MYTAVQHRGMMKNAVELLPTYPPTGQLLSARSSTFRKYNNISLIRMVHPHSGAQADI